MAFIRYLIIVALFGTAICRSISIICPEQELINPCSCDYESKTYTKLLRIQCLGDEELDLIRVFKNLSEALEGMGKELDEFYLNNTRITELPQNVFSDIKFAFIRIEEASRLTRIHRNAFNGTHNSITSLHISNTPVHSSPPDYDIFAAINTMPELMSLTISRADIKEVPNRAFGGLTKLIGINMGYGVLERIGENAFENLDNIQFLSFYMNRINYVANNAFTLSGPSDKTLRIGLFGNHLNDTSLQKGAFDGIKRPVDLQIQYNRDLRVLTQSVFEDLFRQNVLNNITIASLDCNDCHNYWLSHKYSSKSDLITCYDNMNITDVNHFQNCSQDHVLETEL